MATVDLYLATGRWSARSVALGENWTMGFHWRLRARLRALSLRSHKFKGMGIKTPFIHAGSNHVPKDTKHGPNPEQTASIASLLFYTFLDSTIWRAYRVPHLPFDDLPPLSNCDEAKTLMSRSFPVRLGSLSKKDSALIIPTVSKSFRWRKKRPTVPRANQSIPLDSSTSISRAGLDGKHITMQSGHRVLTRLEP